MEITDAREALHVRHSDLTESRFSDAELTRARFDDVNMQGTIFTNANLGGARFVDVNLTSTTIQDANLTGMTINGVLVSDLIRAFAGRPQAVLYAKNLASLQAFYRGMLLPNALLQLTIIQIPEAVASTIHIASPPTRRAETPIKLVFDVEDIAAARYTALRLGGALDPTECEWTFHEHRMCDGHDPEGNVVQFRQKHR